MKCSGKVIHLVDTSDIFTWGTTFVASSYFLVHQAPLQKRSSLTGRNLLSQKANSFHLERETPLDKGDKCILTELPPMHVYSFPNFMGDLLCIYLEIYSFKIKLLWYFDNNPHISFCHILCFIIHFFGVVRC